MSRVVQCCRRTTSTSARWGSPNSARPLGERGRPPHASHAIKFSTHTRTATDRPISRSLGRVCITIRSPYDHISRGHRLTRIDVSGFEPLSAGWLVGWMYYIVPRRNLTSIDTRQVPGHPALPLAPAGGRHGGGAPRRDRAYLAMDFKVILTPPCICH